MFDHMGWEGLTTDQLEQRLIVNRADIAAITAEDMEILEVLDQRQVATADGFGHRTQPRSDDVSHRKPTDLREALVSGEASLSAAMPRPRM